MDKFTAIRRLLHDRCNLQAFNEATQWLAQDPQGREPRLITGYCLKNLCEEAAEKADPHMFEHYYAFLPSLRLDQLGQDMMPNRFCWAIKKLSDSLQNQPTIQMKWIPKILEMAKCHIYVKPERYYSALLESAMKLHGDREKGWIGFYDFMKWWGFDSFLPEDYNKIKTKSGVDMASLADRAHTACYHSLLAGLKQQPCDTAAALEFISYLESLYSQRKAFVNTCYHIAKLYYEIGRKDEAAHAIRRYLRFQKNKFWGWDLLGDCLEDPGLRLACYCRALGCRANPSFIAPVRVKAALMMARLGLHANARHEADRAIDAYRREGWKIKGELNTLISENWYQTSVASPSNDDLYRYYASYAEGAASAR